LGNWHKIYRRRCPGSAHTNVYGLIGDAKSSPPEEAVTPGLEDDSEHEAKLDRRHRCHAASWPVADCALVTAMYAMVRTRSPSADDC